MSKYLAVFDFDETLVEDNSDTAILELVGRDSIPQDIKNIQFTDGWTAFMQGVFNHLYQKGVTADQIKNLIKNLPPVPGMMNLITQISKHPFYDLIIISDCNSCFIKLWLEKQGIDKFFMKIYTNPSEVVNGMFKISPYHNQNTCKLSTKNLCKGQILDSFLDEQKQNGIFYDKVYYTGDGVNDFCPILRLKSTDVANVRNHRKLLDLVNKAKNGRSLDNSGKPHVVKAEVFVWDSGEDIVNRFK